MKGEAYILSVSSQALFSDEPIPSVLHPISLGDRIGIRDLVAVEGGLLILTGPVNTLPRRYDVRFWAPGGVEPVTRAKVPVPGKGKPEGVLVLEETATTYSILIFHDGARNGAPTPLTIDKP